MACRVIDSYKAEILALKAIIASAKDIPITHEANIYGACIKDCEACKLESLLSNAC